jgi:hypothetical protein
VPPHLADTITILIWEQFQKSSILIIL